MNIKTCLIIGCLGAAGVFGWQALSAKMNSQMQVPPQQQERQGLTEVTMGRDGHLKPVIIDLGAES